MIFWWNWSSDFFFLVEDMIPDYTMENENFRGNRAFRKKNNPNWNRMTEVWAAKPQVHLSRSSAGVVQLSEKLGHYRWWMVKQTTWPQLDRPKCWQKTRTCKVPASKSCVFLKKAIWDKLQLKVFEMQLAWNVHEDQRLIMVAKAKQTTICVMLELYILLAIGNCYGLYKK